MSEIKMAWNRADLMQRARTYQRDHKTRLGQSLYNVAYSLNPAIAHLAGTEWDPFYRDDRIESFLDKINAKLGTEEDPRG